MFHAPAHTLPMPARLVVPVEVAADVVSSVISRCQPMPSYVTDALRAFADEPTVAHARVLIEELRRARCPNLATDIEGVL